MSALSRGPSGGPSIDSQWRPRQPWTRLFVAIAPWMLASGIATATMSTELAPRADETELPQMQSPPPPPPAAQPGHSEGDDVYFDPTELISV